MSVLKVTHSVDSHTQQVEIKGQKKIKHAQIKEKQNGYTNIRQNRVEDKNCY